MIKTLRQFVLKPLLDLGAKTVEHDLSFETAEAQHAPEASGSLKTSFWACVNDGAKNDVGLPAKHSCLVWFLQSAVSSILDALWSGESSVVARLYLQQYLGDLARRHRPFLEDKRANNYDWNITNGAEFACVVTCNSLTYLSFQKSPKKIHMHEAKKQPRLMKKHDCNPWYSTEVKVWSLGYEKRFRTLDAKTATPAREDEFWREIVFIPKFQSLTKDLTFKSSDESKD